MKKVIAEAGFSEKFYQEKIDGVPVSGTKRWNSQIRLIEETLTDGSLVYNIEIGGRKDYCEVPCDSEADMKLRYSMLLRCISPSSDYPGELQLAMDSIYYVGARK